MADEKPTIALSELEDCLLWVACEPAFGNQAWICRNTGKTWCISELGDDTGDEESLPEDIGGDSRYLAMPGTRDLDLGNQLALDFARSQETLDFNEVRAIFGRRGAWGNFKYLLERKGLLQTWYAFEQQATREALRAWAEDNDLVVVDDK